LSLDIQTTLRLSTKAIKNNASIQITFDNKPETDWQDELERFDKAIQLDPDNAVFYSRRGEAYKKLGRYEEAVTDYSKAIQLNPNNTVYYHSCRGYNYFLLRNYEEALAGFNEAIKINPNEADFYKARGEAFKTQGKTKLAILDFEKVLSLKPDNVEARQILDGLRGSAVSQEPRQKTAC